MSYQIADMNNGPYGDTFATLEDAWAEHARCVAEGAAINERDGDMTPDEAYAAARDFFHVVELEE